MLINLNYEDLQIDKNFAEEVYKNVNKDFDFKLGNAVLKDDINILGHLLNISKPQIIVETGTNIGLSTLVLTYPEFVEKVITYDLPENEDLHRLIPHEFIGIAFKNTLFENKIEQRFERTTTLDELPVADFYFFDSDHSYDTIFKEYDLAIKAVKKIISLHYFLYFMMQYMIGHGNQRFNIY